MKLCAGVLVVLLIFVVVVVWDRVLDVVAVYFIVVVSDIGFFLVGGNV